MKENSANWGQKITEIYIKEKQPFFNAAHIFDAGGDEKQVFFFVFFGVA